MLSELLSSLGDRNQREVALMIEIVRETTVSGTIIEREITEEATDSQLETDNATTKTVVVTIKISDRIIEFETPKPINRRKRSVMWRKNSDKSLYNNKVVLNINLKVFVRGCATLVAQSDTADAGRLSTSQKTIAHLYYITDSAVDVSGSCKVD